MCVCITCGYIYVSILCRYTCGYICIWAYYMRIYICVSIICGYMCVYYMWIYLKYVLHIDRYVCVYYMYIYITYVLHMDIYVYMYIYINVCVLHVNSIRIYAYTKMYLYTCMYLCIICGYLNVIGLVWFLCLMAYQLFLGYLMPKPFS